MITPSKTLPAVLAAFVTIGCASAAMAAIPSHIEDNRATTALNLLEDKGYGVPLARHADRLAGFTQFQADGRAFAAYVVRNGAAQRLRIDPEAGSVTHS